MSFSHGPVIGACTKNHGPPTISDSPHQYHLILSSWNKHVHIQFIPCCLSRPPLVAASTKALEGEALTQGFISLWHETKAAKHKKTWGLCRCKTSAFQYNMICWQIWWQRWWWHHHHRRLAIRHIDWYHSVTCLPLLPLCKMRLYVKYGGCCCNDWCCT